ncbi:MAG: MarR family transcriptional regulator [Candidatus Omnitrophota bacterium]|nr:MarR family transcriptional regulator [Candidatus Omnitrophota bacterium]
MTTLSLAEFADKVAEIMPVMMREFFRNQPGRFYKTRITIPQFVVLDMLYRSGESNMTDLARHIFVTTAAMTGIVDRLVRDGCIRRAGDPKDRRMIRVMLTSKGTGVVKDMIEKRNRMTMKIFGMISRKDRFEYLRILEHIRDHIRKQEE